MRRWLLLAALTLAGPLAAVPQDAAAPLARARAALQRGDGIAAEADLTKALNAGAQRSDVAAAMGEAQMIQGRLDRAREWLGPANFASHDAAYGWRMLGLLERREGRIAAAGRAYDQALVLTPDDPQLWVDIGRLRYIAGEHGLAIEAADRALAVGPENPRALEFRAELLRDAEGWEAALPLYARAVKAAPNDLALLGSYAATLGEAGRGNDMLQVTRHMLSLAPRNPAPWYLQAVLAARAGDTGLARAMLARAGQPVEDKAAGLLMLGLLELDAGNANVAVGLLDRLLLQQPANQRVQNVLARALLDAGEHDAVLSRFAAIGDRVDAAPYLLTVLARAHEARGDRAKAALLLDRAARSAALPLAGIPPQAQRGNPQDAWLAQPDSLAATISLVRVLLSTEQVEQADRVTARHLSLRPGSADALGLAGDMDLIMERNDAAIERYIASAKIRFPDLLLKRVCEVYARAGRAAEGQALTVRYLQAYPTSLMAARLGADYAAVAGDWQRARHLLENGRTRGLGRDARALADLAFAQLRSGNAEAARATAERAWHLQPQSAHTAQAWGIALAHLGRDRPLARQLLDQAVDLGGSNPLIEAARRKLGVT